MSEAASYGTFAPQGLVSWAIKITRSLPDGWLARRIVMLVRRLVRLRLGDAPVDVDSLGFRMRLLPYNNICEKRMLFTPATFDPRELGLLADRFHHRYIFIDIGANVGAYALFVASRTGPQARVLAIEPQPAIFERLIYNIRLNAFRTIKALDCAVAEKPGEVTLFLDPNNAGESSVKVVGSSRAAPMRIAAKTLLELVQGEGFERIDAIKLDVEGAEDLILEPFLANAPPALLPDLFILEDGSGRWQVDIEDLLRRSGYRLLERTRLNLVYERVPIEKARHD